MTLAIMQPYLLPYIGYWQLIKAVDTFVIYDDVTFIKQGYINKNSILLNNNKYDITLELIGSSSNKNINDILVGNNARKLLKTIKQGYAKAPYINENMSIIEDVLEYEDKNLAKFIGNSIKIISKYLDIKTDIIYSSDIKKDTNLKAQDKVIDICKNLSANQYINSIGGQKLYSKDDFKKENIKLNFLKTGSIEYTQFKNNFIPFLSIVDILMFNSKETIQTFLYKYEFL